MNWFTSRSPRWCFIVLACTSGCHTMPTPATPAAGMMSPDGARQARLGGGSHAPIGAQLYSFREQARRDPIAMLATARGFGITDVETAGLYGMPVARLAEALKSAGMHASSMHASYDDFKKTPETVIANARAIGARYVGLAWYPHTGAFTETDARHAIADFNRFGRAMKDAGLVFFYHNHGYEPVAYGNGTLLDLIITKTDPSLVSFELDVLWAWLPGVDPAAIIRKYPGRFKLMHIKDMKAGVARGSLTGGLAADLQAVIGQGQVNWAELLKAAERDGLEHYYLEDETPDPLTNVPKSIVYLEGLRY